MKRLNLLLLDTSVILELLEKGIWPQVISRCETYVARTVVQEAKFTKDDDGFAIDVDLGEDEKASRIHVFDIEASRVMAFKNQFLPGVFARLDPGELESLVYLFGEASEDCQIASSDAIVFRILGSCSKGDQGISLEEILHTLGLTRPLLRQFSRKFREDWTQRGFAENLNGQTFRTGCTAQTCAAAAKAKSSPHAHLRHDRPHKN